MNAVQRLVGGGAVAFAAALTSACRQAPPAEFRVGLIGVFEGINATVSGRPALRGAQLAVDELNAAGGVVIGGVTHRVVLIPRTCAERPDAAASVARRLVNLDSVDVLVGPQFSDLASVAGAVAEDAQVPMIAPMASAADVTRGRAFVNRLAFVDATQGRLLARFAADSLGLRRVAAMRLASSKYSRDVATLFSQEFRRAGGAIVADATFDDEDPATRVAARRRVLDARPDGVLLLSLEIADTLDLRRLRAGGYTGRILGADYWDAPSLERDPDMRGAVFISNWDRRIDRPETRAFRRAFAARHPDDPPRATAAATYDAIRLLAVAVTRAGSRTGPRVAAALRGMGDVAGAFGRTRFTGTGDPLRGGVILEMAGDSTRLRAIVDPAP